MLYWSYFWGVKIGINIHQPDLVGPWLQGSMDVNAEHQPGYLTTSMFIKKRETFLLVHHGGFICFSPARYIT